MGNSRDPKFWRSSRYGAVSLWQTRLPTEPCAEDARLLRPDELQRAARFAFARDVARFMAARAFLRRVLGERLDADPASLVFAYGRHGRPRLAGPGPDFNLSHAEDLVVLAVSPDGPVGIDVEAVRNVEDRDALARQVMDVAELAAFSALPEAKRDGAFFRLWTRKEAMLKAAGTGLSRDPRTLYVGVGADVPPPRSAARLVDLSAPPGFAMALCAPARELAAPATAP